MPTEDQAQPPAPSLRPGWEQRGEHGGKPVYWCGELNVLWNQYAWIIGMDPLRDTSKDPRFGADLEAAMQHAERLAAASKPAEPAPPAESAREQHRYIPTELDDALAELEAERLRKTVLQESVDGCAQQTVRLVAERDDARAKLYLAQADRDVARSENAILRGNLADARAKLAELQAYDREYIARTDAHHDQLAADNDALRAKLADEQHAYGVAKETLAAVVKSGHEAERILRAKLADAAKDLDELRDQSAGWWLELEAAWKATGVPVRGLGVQLAEVIEQRWQLIGDLTIRHAQTRQPWTVPYAGGVMHASRTSVPHILGTHVVLHAAKSVGKLAAVFEALDHEGARATDEQRAVIADMAADLMTAALRFANLGSFDLADELKRRVREKNGVDLPPMAAPSPQPSPAGDERRKRLRALRHSVLVADKGHQVCAVCRYAFDLSKQHTDDCRFMAALAALDAPAAEPAPAPQPERPALPGWTWESDTRAVHPSGAVVARHDGAELWSWYVPGSNDCPLVRRRDTAAPAAALALGFRLLCGDGYSVWVHDTLGRGQECSGAERAALAALEHHARRAGET